MRLGASWALLGASLGRDWACLGSVLARPGASWNRLGSSLAHLGESCRFLPPFDSAYPPPTPDGLTNGPGNQNTARAVAHSPPGIKETLN